ncbi:hypothetical protein 278BB001_243 [Bacillus phage 278BB001]|nr:hypothetical protein 278BB001_243 [Bacillus phage 278BB001]
MKHKKSGVFSHLILTQHVDEVGNTHKFGTSDAVYDKDGTALDYQLDFEEGDVTIEIQSFNHLEDCIEEVLFTATEEDLEFFKQMVEDMEHVFTLKRLRKVPSSDTIVEDITGGERGEE